MNNDIKFLEIEWRTPLPLTNPITRQLDLRTSELNWTTTCENI